MARHGMNTFGGFSLGIGLIWGVVAYFLSMTESTYSTTYNIGAIAHREINVFVAAIFIISGILLIGFGHVLDALSAEVRDKLTNEVQQREKESFVERQNADLSEE